MQRRTLIGAGLAPLAGPLACSLATPAVAQAAYPTRPLELVVPFGAGGGTDVLARALAEAVRKHLGQTVTVVNKPGASGSIGMADVANAPPDGYKLIMLTVEATILPHIGIGKVSHEDFAPIARLNFDPSAITVRSDAPWNTVEEFLDAARKRSGEIKVGNAGPGSIWHVAAVALESRTGTRFNHIPFQGAGPAVLALAGGHVDALAVSPAEVTAQVQAGRLKVLAVAAEQRAKGFDKVPTFKERGIDLSLGAWRGLCAPKATPPTVLAALSTAVAKAVQEPAYRETLDKLNLGAAYTDAASFRVAMDRDSQAFKALASKLEIKS
jgi:tripartite-type tricarboxylate transporter receptor subunit TctC